MTQREECRSDLLTWIVVLIPENTFIITSAPGFPCGASSKEPTYQWRDAGLILGSGRSPRVGNDNPFQYSSLEDPMDRGAGWAVVVHRVTNSRTWLTKPLHHWIKLCLPNKYTRTICQHLTRKFHILHLFATSWTRTASHSVSKYSSRKNMSTETW